MFSVYCELTFTEICMGLLTKLPVENLNMNINNLEDFTNQSASDMYMPQKELELIPSTDSQYVGVYGSIDNVYNSGIGSISFTVQAHTVEVLLESEIVSF